MEEGGDGDGSGDGSGSGDVIGLVSVYYVWGRFLAVDALVNRWVVEGCCMRVCGYAFWATDL